jgi:hypothetical protein
LASLRRAFLKEEKSSMRGVRSTLNECHRNWRFYKLWLLIGPSFAILAIKAATGKRGDDQEEQVLQGLETEGWRKEHTISHQVGSHLWVLGRLGIA